MCMCSCVFTHVCVWIRVCMYACVFTCLCVFSARCGTYLTYTCRWVNTCRLANEVFGWLSVLCMESWLTRTQLKRFDRPLRTTRWIPSKFWCTRRTVSIWGSKPHFMCRELEVLLPRLWLIGFDSFSSSSYWKPLCVTNQLRLHLFFSRELVLSLSVHLWIAPGRHWGEAGEACPVFLWLCLP